MKKTKIVIHVEGGIVQAVFSDAENLDIEVIDLDEPDFATDDELKEFTSLQCRFNEIKKSLPAIY